MVIASQWLEGRYREIGVRGDAESDLIVVTEWWKIQELLDDLRPDHKVILGATHVLEVDYLLHNPLTSKTLECIANCSHGNFAVPRESSRRSRTIHGYIAKDLTR